MKKGDDNMELKRFVTFAKRGYIGNELYVFGLIHGLQIALCDLNLTSSYDCELFDKFMMYTTDTTQDKYNAFRETVETIYQVTFGC